MLLGLGEFVVTRRVHASPEVVFDTASDLDRYPEFMPVRRAELERAGGSEPMGPGAVRALYFLGPPLRERVITFERPRSIVYEVVSGLPVRDHVGTITIERDGAGSVIRWRVVTTPTIPLGGPILVAGVKLLVGRVARAIQKEAEARAAGESRGSGIR
jgi:hypothetical protein